MINQYIYDWKFKMSESNIVTNKNKICTQISANYTKMGETNINMHHLGYENTPVYKNIDINYCSL